MEDQAKELYAGIVAKCWADKEFKKNLVADPAGTLKAEGFDVPSGIQINVVDNGEQVSASNEQVLNLFIPEQPGELTDDMLSEVAGGFTHSFRSGSRSHREGSMSEHALKSLTHYIDLAPLLRSIFGKKQ